MEDRATLIQELDAARQKLGEELENMDPQMEICPGWTVTHLLAHLIGWDEVTAASLRAYALGKDLGTPAAGGIDNYNARSAARRAGLSYDDLVKELDLARDELKAALLAVPADKAAKPLLFPWGSTGTLRDIAAIFAGHELEHAEELRTLKTHAPRPAQ